MRYVRSIYNSAVSNLVSLLNQHRLACFKADSCPESGDWLNSIPNNRVGTFIDNDTLRIGVALRVGLSVCIPHRCKCEKTVDAFSMHTLSCRFSAGRIPCHSPFCRRDTVHTRTVESYRRRRKATRWNKSVPLNEAPLSRGRD